MIKIDKPKDGRPGDLFLTTPPAPMAVSGLDRPDNRYGSAIWSLGLDLDDLDMRAVADAMQKAFRTAHPEVEGPIRLPFRRTRLGQWLLFAETTKTPVILDGDGAPIPPPRAGANIVMNAKIAPFHRPEKGRQGCGLYLNKIRLAPAAIDRELTR